MKIQLPTKTAKKKKKHVAGYGSPPSSCLQLGCSKTLRSFHSRKKMWRFLFKPLFKCASFNKIQLTKINPLVRHPVPQIPPPRLSRWWNWGGGSQPGFPLNRFSKRRFPVFYLRFFGTGKWPGRFRSTNWVFLVVVVICLGFWGEEEGRDHQEFLGHENFKIQNLDWLNCLCCSILHFLSMTNKFIHGVGSLPKTLKMGWHDIDEQLYVQLVGFDPKKMIVNWVIFPLSKWKPKNNHLEMILKPPFSSCTSDHTIKVYLGQGSIHVLETFPECSCWLAGFFQVNPSNNVHANCLPAYFMPTWSFKKKKYA